MRKRCFICKDKGHITTECPFKAILPSKKCSSMEEEEKLDHENEEIFKEEFVTAPREH